jgi:hypothetical protein
MKLVPVRDVSSMALEIAALMVKEKRERKASSVAHTSARTKMTILPTILVKFHIAVYEKVTEGVSGDWAPGSQPPPASTTAAAIHAASQYAPPEGYYPVYYPPPPGTFMPPHDGQSGPDGSPPHANGQPPMMPYYIHPGSYPPFPHYPPMYPSQGVTSSSGTSLPPPPPPTQGQAEQPQTINPADAARKPEDPSLPPVGQNGTAAAAVVPLHKKRSKTTKNGESKSKKAKVVARLEKDKDGEILQPPPAHTKPPTNDGSDPDNPVTTV